MASSTDNKIPYVDSWKCEPEDIIFKHSKNMIIAPLSKFYHLDNQDFRIDSFILNTKKSYNSEDLRNHFCTYVNYFEKYFDEDKEYFSNLCKIKFLIDCYHEYKKENFFFDINRYIIQPSIYLKTKAMVDYNYNLQLVYKSANNPQLQYTDEHAKTLLHQSLIMNLCIPLITHFAYMRRIADIDEFILDIYDNILYYPAFAAVDIPSKLYQTSISNVNRNVKNNAVIWARQDIRGKDAITHSMAAVRNIILNIMPKYAFNQNMVSLNYTSIQKNNRFQVTDFKDR